MTGCTQLKSIRGASSSNQSSSSPMVSPSPSLSLSSSGSESSSSTSALTLSPTTAYLFGGSTGTRAFSASGGSGSGYVYSLVSGPGSIDSSGVYHYSGYHTIPAVISVKDSAGSVALSTVVFSSGLTNGTVTTMATSSDSLYIGGLFTALSPYHVPAIAALSLTDGSVLSSTDFQSGFQNGTSNVLINAAIVVGTSLYVGGSFLTYQGLPAQNLAKIDLTTGLLDTTFTQSTGMSVGSAGYVVNALAVSGSSLYVGGSFSTYRNDSNTGTLTVNNLAKIDLISGNLDTTFSRSIGMSNQVYALAVSGSSLYVGGQFTTYRNNTNTGTLSANYLAKVDLTSGNLDTAFTQSIGFSNMVFALTTYGSSLYVGGFFSTYRNNTNTGTLPTNNLAKVDLTSGNLDTTFTQSTGFTQNPGPGSSIVYALSVSGSSLYVGGQFTTYRNNTNTGTLPANNLAKIDLISGNLDTTFTQSIGMSARVNALVVSGSSLYAGGNFTTYRNNTNTGTLSAVRLAKVDLTSGSLDTTFTQSTGINNQVYALAASGSSLYALGGFVSYRGMPAQNIAKVDPVSFAVDTVFTQSIGMNSGVSALAVSGNSLYVGGGFTTYRNDTNTGTLPANYLAKVDLITGNLDTAFTQSIGMSAYVNRLVVSGSSLYVGGQFTTYRNNTNSGTLPALRLAKMDLTSGHLDTTFTQSIGMNNTVNALAVSGSSLYVGGQFTTYRNNTNTGTLSAVRLAKVDLTSGNLDTTFTRSIGMSSTVMAFAVSSTSLYMGGWFTTYRNDTNTGTFPANYLAKVDLASGNLDTTFTQSIGTGGQVEGLAFFSGSLYVAGGFSTYRNNTNTGTLSALRLAKVDATSGNLDTTFTQSTGVSNTTTALAIFDNSLYVGGGFISYRNNVVSSFASLDLYSGDLNF